MNGYDEKDLLARELRERSGEVGGHPIGLDAVRQSARRIRRRRQIVTGAVAAVVASIAVPSGIALTSSVDGPDGPVKEPTVATSPTDTTSPPAPAPRPDGTFPLTLQGLSRGPGARLPYVDSLKDALVTPEGSVALPESYGMITPYDGGWLAIGSSQHPGKVIRLDAGMNVVHTGPSGGGDLAVSADGSHVAYTVRKSRDQVLLVDAPTDGTDPVTWTVDVPGGEALDPVGFLDDDTVVFNSDAANVMGIARPGATTTPVDGFLRVDDASEAGGLVSGLVSYGVDSGCSGGQDPATGRLLWKTCDGSNLRFSPDGRLVVADAASSDGPGSPTLTVLDARTGDEVVAFTPQRRDTVVGVTQVAWEDDDTMLAYLDEGGDQALVRLRLDGSVEAVTGTVSTQDMRVWLWFAEQPRR
jgi:hypothetical protein